MSIYMITIDNDEYKGEAKVLNVDTNKECMIKITYGTQKYNAKTQYIEFNTENFEEKKKLPVELFEEQLEITDEQQQKLFESWGKTKAIMIKDISEKLDISRDIAIGIISLANKCGLIERGHNNTWRVVNSILQDRWKDAAAKLERGDRPLNSEIPTVQESVERLNKQSTEEEKRIARGEKGMISSSSSNNMLPKKNLTKNTKNVIREESSMDSIVDDTKIYSGATKAKQTEKEAWEKKVAEDKQKALQEMNKQNTGTLSKCVTVLQRKK